MTGVVALLLSVEPTLTIADVRDVLRSTADPTGSFVLGAGRVNALRAVRAVEAMDHDPESGSRVGHRPP